MKKALNLAALSIILLLLRSMTIRFFSSISYIFFITRSGFQRGKIQKALFLRIISHNRLITFSFRKKLFSGPDRGMHKCRGGIQYFITKLYI